MNAIKKRRIEKKQAELFEAEIEKDIKILEKFEEELEEEYRRAPTERHWIEALKGKY